MFKYKYSLLSLLILIGFGITSSFCSCACTNPSYDEEVVFMKTPMIFGETKVDTTPAHSFTCYAFTTTAYVFPTLPQKVEYKFNDLLSNDNTPLDVKIYLIYQIKKGKSPILLQNYGYSWFNTFINPYFNNKVRESISGYSPFDLMSNRQVIAQFDTDLKKVMNDYVKNLSQTQGEFPITITQVITDRVMPNEEQLQEMNKTAAAIQAKQTQEKRAEMENARVKAETARAIADKSYVKEMNLSPAQFIQLRQWDVIDKKNNANVNIIMGNLGTPIWNMK